MGVGAGTANVAVDVGIGIATNVGAGVEVLAELWVSCNFDPPEEPPEPQYSLITVLFTEMSFAKISTFDSTHPF